MTNVMKKLSALLLTLALVFTMMPALSLGAYAADDNVLTAGINGESKGGVTAAWMEENKEAAQIFPYVSRKGNEWGYVIAEGPSYEAFLMEALGLEDISDIREGKLVWTASDGVFKNILTVDELMNAKTQFKLVDQDGKDVVGAFGDAVTEIKSAEVVAIEGADAVTPVIATAHSKLVYATYEEAAAALADGSWKTDAETDLRPYIAGNLGARTILKTDGAVDMETPNFTGRFSVADPVSVDVQIAPPATAKSSLTFTKTTAKTVSAGCSDFVIDLFGGLTWKSSNSKIAKVDKNGKVTPTGIGKCTVKATLGSGDVAAEVAVTVKEAAFKPTAPKSLKAKNVNKKSVQLSWKKVSGASGYEVYRSLKKKSGFKKVTTIKKGTTVKYKNKKLKKKKTYYYKVRAYRTVNGKKVYSSYSSVAKVKIKK